MGSRLLSLHKPLVKSFGATSIPRLIVLIFLKFQVKTPHLILAPMPGKITKIFIDSGSQVQKSQALLVMEAMKMEYTLKSDLNTVVEKVNVQVGDQVTLGSLLIELKPEVVV